MVRCLSCFQLYPFVVVEVDIFGNQLLGLFEGGQGAMAEVFFLEMREEILCRGIIPAVTPARHGGRDAILLDNDIMIRLRSVLMPLVTVEDQSIRDLFVFFGLLQGAQDKGNVIALVDDIPNEKAIEEILENGKENPALLRTNVGNIRDPFLVRLAGCDLNNSMALVTRTVRQAKQKEPTTDGLILHSDQGTQYTSQTYHELLTKEYDITPSMSRRGNCWDNAPMENFFGHLKEEYLRQFKQTTFKEMEQLIDEYIYFYNYERIQLKTKTIRSGR